MINDNEDCIKELTGVVERCRSNTHRIDEIKKEMEKNYTEHQQIREENKSLHKIATSVELIAKDISYMKKDISLVKDSQEKLSCKVSEIEVAPSIRSAKNIEKLKLSVITAITTMIATGVVSSLIYFSQSK